MRRIGILMACGALTLAFGCDGGNPPIMLMDGGPDSGPPAMPDSGPPAMPDAGDGCPPAMSPAPSMPMACEADTLSCLMTAGTADAQQACIDADANPDACSGCIQADIFFTCTNGGGCEETFGELQCCLMDECPTGGETCIDGALMGACATTFNTFGMCLNSAQMAMQCGVTTTCFQSAGGGFQPDFDRHAIPFQSSSYREWLVRALTRDGLGL